MQETLGHIRLRLPCRQLLSINNDQDVPFIFSSCLAANKTKNPFYQSGKRLKQVCSLKQMFSTALYEFCMAKKTPFVVVIYFGTSFIKIKQFGIKCFDYNNKTLM